MNPEFLESRFFRIRDPELKRKAHRNLGLKRNCRDFELNILQKRNARKIRVETAEKDIPVATGQSARCLSASTSVQCNYIDTRGISGS